MYHHNICWGAISHMWEGSRAAFCLCGARLGTWAPATVVCGYPSRIGAADTIHRRGGHDRHRSRHQLAPTGVALRAVGVPRLRSCPPPPWPPAVI